MRTDTYVDADGLRRKLPRGAMILAMAALLPLVVASIIGKVSAAESQDRIVGTLQRIDASQQRIVVGNDSQIRGRREEAIRVYHDAGTTVARQGRAVPVTNLKLGDRLLITTERSANRVKAGDIRVLADATPGQVAGGYMHGTVLHVGKDFLNINQLPGRKFFRIDYDDATTAASLDGRPLDVGALAQGAEVDMSLSLSGSIPKAKAIVVLDPP